MNIVIIGGSAQSTPRLLMYLAQQEPTFPLNITLAGRSKEKLRAMTRVGRLLCQSPRVHIAQATFRDASPRPWLKAADLVLIQVRVGGYRGRTFDETFPLRYGVCGDEGLGPSGLSAAWRGWPVIRPLLQEIRRVCPKTRVLMLSSPLGLLVRAARDAFPHLTLSGICELPWTTLSKVCGELSVPAEEATFDYAGVNHLGCLFRLRYQSRDLVGEYARMRRDTSSFPTRQVIESLGGIPLSYLHLHLFPREALTEQQLRKRTRGNELEALSRAAFPVYRHGSRDEIDSVLARRAAPWYPHAVGPFILALGGQKVRVPFFLSVPNEGFLGSLRDDDVVECAHTVCDAKVARCRLRSPVPRALLEMTGKFVKYERLAAAAVCAGSQQGLKAALAAHPWVPGTTKAAEMARDIVKYAGLPRPPKLQHGQRVNA